MEFLIEFITVVRNDKLALIRTIESLDETFKKFNLYEKISHLVVDGASNDGTLEYLQSIQKHRSLNTRLISEPDEGIYDAMNKGVLYSKGLTLIFLNAGDILADQADLGKLVFDAATMLSKENVFATAYSAFLRFSNRSILIKSRNISFSSPKLPTIHQSMLYVRSGLIANPYDTSFKICGDYEQFARSYSNGNYVIVKNMPLAVFFSGGISSQLPFVLYRESIKISGMYFTLTGFESFRLRFRLIRSLLVFSVLNRLFA